MQPVHPHLSTRLRRAFMLAYFACMAVGMVACQSAAKPGEATITGGQATASRHEDDGWEIVIEKAAPQKLQPVEVTLEIMEAPQ